LEIKATPSAPAVGWALFYAEIQILLIDYTYQIPQNIFIISLLPLCKEGLDQLPSSSTSYIYPPAS